MKKRNILIITIVILGLLIVGAGVYSISVINKPLKETGEQVVTIEEGETFNGFLKDLSSKGKIKNRFIIKLFTKIKGMDIDVLPGQYILNGNMSIGQIINSLTSGSEYNLANVTIPEGFSVDDISATLEKSGVCSADEFKKAVQNYHLPTFVKEDSKKRYNLEGYLFPDTYKFELNSDPNHIIEVMLDRFKEVWADITKELNVNIADGDIEKYMTIASMVEKEGRADDERSTISSVIYNRINKGMLLQIDATVLYAHGVHLEKVLYSHLEIDSPYNTYKYAGLPIGPISNPGKPSIVAAIKPKETNYLFYLQESENHHYFTDNYDDFLKKKDELGY